MHVIALVCKLSRIEVCSDISEALTFALCSLLCFTACNILPDCNRWEGMAASTNCSSYMNCCATLWTYLSQTLTACFHDKYREQ